MLHRLFSAATSAAALKGKSLAVEEEEIAKSRQMLYGYGVMGAGETDEGRFLPEVPGDPCVGARVLILKDEAGRKDKVYLYDSQKDERVFRSDRYSPPPKRVCIGRGQADCVDGSRFRGHYRVHVRRDTVILQGHDDKVTSHPPHQPHRPHKSPALHTLIHRPRAGRGQLDCRESEFELGE
jgi:hypothetical protein